MGRQRTERVGSGGADRQRAPGRGRCFASNEPRPSWRSPPARPIVLGTLAALALGHVVDLGLVSERLSQALVVGRADAQEARPTNGAAETEPAAMPQDAADGAGVPQPMDERAPQPTPAPTQVDESTDPAAPLNGAVPSLGAVQEPSDADRAALRYFAEQGEVERLEAELRRLRALYPDWQPPQDLLEVQTEDAELETIWRLVGEQRFEEAQTAIDARLQRDPTWEVPPRMSALIELAEIRVSLIEASEAEDYERVLSIAAENERILTCDNVDTLWRVADAFIATDRPRRAYDAYAYVIAGCEDEAERAASLQKAAQKLDPQLVSELFALEDAARPGTALAGARLNIVRGAVAAAAERRGIDVPRPWLNILAEHARDGTTLSDAMLVGHYLFRQGFADAAAKWFRFALDRGLGADAAEGYIVALRATGLRADAALAREVAYAWREQTPELMESYLDAVATLLTADDFGETSVTDVEQTVVDRFVPVVIGQRDANGAQALGWYAFNTCQFDIAEEWFISSANWVPTEAALFGLALTRLRLADEGGFEEVVEEWGPIYDTVARLATGSDLVDPDDPVTGAEDDPTDEVGVDRVICDETGREALRELIVDERPRAGRVVPRDAAATIEAGSLPLTAPLARGAADATNPLQKRGQAPAAGPRRPGAPVLLEIQAGPSQPADADGAGGLPLPVPVPRQTPPSIPPEAPDIADAVFVPIPTGEEAATPAPPPSTAPQEAPPAPRAPAERAENAARQAPRQVRPAERRRARARLDGEVAEIVARRQTRSAARSGSGGTAAQRALSSRDFARCVHLTDRAIARGTLSATDAAARGFCLLELERPFEAAQAFQLARLARAPAGAANDVVYGASLSALAANLTNEAAVVATEAPLSRPRRTELQTEILTQRALAANRDGRPVEALHFLHQRNQIAPLQKDLMLLQGFAYRDAGNFRAAREIFQALDAAGSTRQTRRALTLIAEDLNDPALAALP